MPSMQTQIASTQARFNIKVRKSGKIRPAALSDPQMKAIGDRMVTDQWHRWLRGINANGQPAKKLSVRYAIIKQAVLHKRPIRDMLLTGRTIKNFSLRKAAASKIRAENTTRYERDKASGCNNYDQMIGFSVQDAKSVFDEADKQFGQYLRTAWIPLDGTNRRPGALNAQVKA